MKSKQPYEQHFYTARPTKLTKFMRVNLITQLWRFLVLNVKMLRMVRKH